MGQKLQTSPNVLHELSCHFQSHDEVFQKLKSDILRRDPSLRFKLKWFRDFNILNIGCYLSM